MLITSTRSSLTTRRRFVALVCVVIAGCEETPAGTVRHAAARVERLEPGDFVVYSIEYGSTTQFENLLHLSVNVGIEALQIETGDEVWSVLSCPDGRGGLRETEVATTATQLEFPAFHTNRVVRAGAPFVESCTFELDATAIQHPAELEWESWVRVEFSGVEAGERIEYDLFIDIEEIDRDPQREENGT